MTDPTTPAAGEALTAESITLLDINDSPATGRLTRGVLADYLRMVEAAASRREEALLLASFDDVARCHDADHTALAARPVEARVKRVEAALRLASFIVTNARMNGLHGATVVHLRDAINALALAAPDPATTPVVGRGWDDVEMFISPAGTEYNLRVEVDTTKTESGDTTPPAPGAYGPGISGEALSNLRFTYEPTTLQAGRRYTLDSQGVLRDDTGAVIATPTPPAPAGRGERCAECGIALTAAHFQATGHRQPAGRAEVER